MYRITSYKIQDNVNKIVFIVLRYIHCPSLIQSIIDSSRDLILYYKLKGSYKFTKMNVLSKSSLTGQ